MELVRRLAEEFRRADRSHPASQATQDQQRLTVQREARDQPALNLRYTHQIPGHTRAALEEDPHLYRGHAAELLGVTRGTVVRWIELGLLKASQIMPGTLASPSDRVGPPPVSGR